MRYLTKFTYIFILVILLAILWPTPADAQTPTLVQAASCPYSNGIGSPAISTTPDYTCQLPELTLAGNFIGMGMIFDNGNTPTLTVTSIDGSGATVDTLSQIVTNTTANSNVQRIYAVTNSAGGAKAIKVHFSALNNGFVEMNVGEWYNVSTTASGTPVCNQVVSNTVTSGNITVASGGLIINNMTNDSGLAATGLSAGSGFSFAADDRNDRSAMQFGLGTGSAINPTITIASGTPQSTGSCSAGWTAATAGTAPTVTNRVLNLAHAQMPASSANPYIIQEPISGNLIVIHMHGGADSAITGIADTASNTYNCITAQIQGGNADQLCYSLTGNTSNTDAISITRSGTTADATFMTYDITAPGFTFDTSTGGGASSGSTTGPLTTCSSCFTPGAQNELIFSAAGWDFGTANGATAPSGNFFNSAVFTGNGFNGPQTVDQNNGWLMYRNGASTSTISVTWTFLTDGTHAIGSYSWTVASFKPPSGVPGQPDEDYWSVTTLQQATWKVSIFSGFLLGLMLAGAALIYPYTSKGTHGVTYSVSRSHSKELLFVSTSNSHGRMDGIGLTSQAELLGSEAGDLYSAKDGEATEDDIYRRS